MIWVAVIVIAAILESMSAQLISIWFVGGGIAGMIAQLCGAPVWLQVLIAAVVTLVLLLATRPLVKKFCKTRKRTRTPTAWWGDRRCDGGIVTLRRMDAWKCSATTGQHAAQKMSVFKKAQRCRWCALRA